MPIVTIQLAKGRSVAMKRAAAEAITDVVSETLRAPRRAVTVIFTEVERENWATAGALHSDSGAGYGADPEKG
jgi:4-oxalocrotonate tautomerase